MAHIHLNEQEVHLWVVNYYNVEKYYSIYKECLTQEEKERKKQFATDSLKKRFAISRALLRLLLEYYLSQHHTKLELLYGRQGKPSLVNKSFGFEFNLSHSQDMIVYAFSRKFPIGVDIEYINPNILNHNIEINTLSSSERTLFYQLDHYQRVMAFFRAWTRKEAILKAYGIGLSKPLEEIEVTFMEAEPARVKRIDGDIHQAATWSLHNIEKIPGYCGAIAAQAPLNTMQIIYQSIDEKQLENSADFLDYLCKYHSFRCK